MKNVLLLASLYPLFLFFVIGYTFIYTHQKGETDYMMQTRSVNFFNNAFLSPIPTLFLPQNPVQTEKASVSAAANLTTDIPEAASMSAQNDANDKESSESGSVTASDKKLEADKIIQTMKSSITPLPTPIKESLQNIREKSAIIIENDASSAIIPSASSLIIENAAEMSQYTVDFTDR